MGWLLNSSGWKRGLAILLLVLSQIPAAAPLVAILNQVLSLLGLNVLSGAAVLGSIGVAHSLVKK